MTEKPIIGVEPENKYRVLIAAERLEPGQKCCITNTGEVVSIPKPKEKKKFLVGFHASNIVEAESESKAIDKTYRIVEELSEADFIIQEIETVSELEK